MRVMVIVKASPNSEHGILPKEEMLARMTRYNEELVKAGILIASHGLRASRRGKRVSFQDGKKPRVIDGPFAETKELIAGYWLWEVRSMDEALEWARKCPNPSPGEDGMLELREVFEDDDFGAEFTPELRAREAALRAEIERQRTPGAR
jgi:hypothetical protein